MTFTHHERLGRYRGQPYFLSLRAEPGLNDPAEFAVVLYFSTTDGDRRQVARIDTDHGYTHIDRLYRRDEAKDPLDVDFFEAWDHMTERWRTYAGEYEKTQRDRD